MPSRPRGGRALARNASTDSELGAEQDKKPTRRLQMTRHGAVLATAVLLILVLYQVSRPAQAPRAIGTRKHRPVLPTGLEVEWRLPIGCDYSGFFMEVVMGYLPGLHERRVKAGPDAAPRVVLLSGECDAAFLQGLEPADAEAYRAAWSSEADRSREQTARAIAIEHGDPCSMRTWASASDRPLHVVARAMSEGDLEPAAAECLRAADEVWVPTAWHVERFAAAGVPRRSLRVVPEPIDTGFFSPQPAADAPGKPPCEGAPCGGPFVFLSVFKWESRKGWDLLLRAYWAEFGAADGVRLVLKTYLPSWEPGPRDLNEAVEGFAREHQGEGRDALPPVQLVLEENLSRRGLRELYTAAHSFVLPTRGEGWGLPVVEAMAMGVPAIATNFSGPTAYLTQANGFPLPVARKLPGGQAEPSIEALRLAMRAAYAEHGTPAAAARAGRARDDMRRFSRPAVTDLVVQRLAEIAEVLSEAAQRHAAPKRAAPAGSSLYSTVKP